MILTKPYIIEGYLLKEKATIVLQEKVHKYDYLSVNMNEILTKEQSEEFHNFLSNLPEEYIYREDNDYGIERDIHITVYYGLINDGYNFKLIKQFIERNIESIDLAIKGIGFFRHDNSPFDVMKFDIYSEALTKIHNFIDSSFANENTFKEYSPHMTIAYIKKGAFSDNQWEGKNDFSFCNTPIDIPEIEYQDMWGNKKIIYI